MATVAERSILKKYINLEPLICSSCGIQYSVSYTWVRDRQKDHRTFYCPNGHAEWFPQDNEEEKLRKQLAAANGNASYYQKRAEKLERSRSALRGVATRLRNKLGNGECPYCAELFPDLAGHVAQCHPEIDPNDLGEAER